MKISIITVTLNSEKTLPYTLFSVFKQTYKNIEHIIVDGGSTDETINISKKHKIKNKKIYILKNSSIYQAINYGITKSTGDYILILNSDDILDTPNILKQVSRLLIENKNKIGLGNVSYFNRVKFEEIVRIYKASSFKRWMFIFGMMPPHPGAFVPKNVAKKYLYNSKYSIAADFDLFLRIFYINKYEFFPLNLTITRMRTGGVSGKNLFSHFQSTIEISKSLSANNLQYFFSIFYFFRFIFKLTQFFIYKKMKIFRINKYYKKLIKYDIKIIKNIKSLDLNKNFVLSALNLAFLGSLVKKELKLYNELIHWPDGKYSLNFTKNLKKIPGRDLINKINLKGNINRIVVVGDLPDVAKKFIEKKFHRKVINYKVPYGNIKEITNNLKIKLKKKDLCFTTLPTPKQERVAEYIVSKNKKFKIICIGGSINIASGIEKAVPKLFNKFEFVWRLQYDSSRRLKRLFITFFNYLYGKYILKDFHNLICINIK